MLEHILKAQAKSDELAARMAEPEVLNNRDLLAKVASAHSELQPLITVGTEYRTVLEHVAEAEEVLASETDADMRELAQEELAEGLARREELEQRIKILLLPKDEYDDRNVIVEIRAGTGGEEAALFAADLYRMYMRYAETQKWKVEELTRHETGLQGMKEVTCAITGKNVYSRLKFEGGVHRVQRVPDTEASGRIHTSAVTVALTELAAREVRKFLKQENLSLESAGLRVSVRPGGCSGFEYGLDIEEDPREDDFLLASHRVRLFVDPFSAQYLSGILIDYHSSFEGSGFSFENPNATGGCGCGTSFSA